MKPVAEKVGTDDLGIVAKTIAEAFADDPITQWTFGKPDLFRRTLVSLMKDVYLRRGFITKSGDKAASVWLRPGESAESSLMGVLQYIGSTVPRAGFGPLIRGMRLDARMGALKPQTPLLYLFLVGVRPGAQGQGLGSLLIKDGLQMADKGGFPAYLESSKEENIPLYQRHGFEVVQEARVDDTSPPFWTMIRQPRPVAA
ncbi:MAG: GNAT family N-acetyltransferase [Pseudomonadota bacterium]